MAGPGTGRVALVAVLAAALAGARPVKIPGRTVEEGVALGASCANVVGDAVRAAVPRAPHAALPT